MAQLNEKRCISLGYGYVVNRDMALDHSRDLNFERIEDYMEANDIYLGITQGMANFECFVSLTSKTIRKYILMNDDERHIFSTLVSEINIDNIKLDENQMVCLKHEAKMMGADITKDPTLILAVTD